MWYFNLFFDQWFFSLSGFHARTVNRWNLTLLSNGITTWISRVIGYFAHQTLRHAYYKKWCRCCLRRFGTSDKQWRFQTDKGCPLWCNPDTPSGLPVSSLSSASSCISMATSVAGSRNWHWSHFFIFGKTFFNLSPFCLESLIAGVESKMKCSMHNILHGVEMRWEATNSWFVDIFESALRPELERPIDVVNLKIDDHLLIDNGTTFFVSVFY